MSRLSTWHDLRKPYLIPNKCMTTFQWSSQAKAPGRILKTSPDLSETAVIANARQGERVSLLRAAAPRMNPVTSATGESLGRK